MPRMPRFLSRFLASGLVAVVALGAAAFAQTGRMRPHGAPEIDPSIAAAGVTILVGGTFLLTGRRRDPTQ